MLDRCFPAGRVLERLRSGDLGVGLNALAAYLGQRGHSFEVVQEYVLGGAAWWVGAGGSTFHRSVSYLRPRRLCNGHYRVSSPDAETRGWIGPRWMYTRSNTEPEAGRRSSG